MRFYPIALFLACMYVVVGLMANQMEGIGIYGIKVESVSNATTAAAASTQLEAVKNRVQTNSTATPTDILAGALGMFYQQVMNGINTLFDKVASPIVGYLVWLPVYLAWIGVPSEFAWGLFGLVLVIEAIGFLEIVTGREIER